MIPLEEIQFPDWVKTHLFHMDSVFHLCSLSPARCRQGLIWARENKMWGCQIQELILVEQFASRVELCLYETPVLWTHYPNAIKKRGKNSAPNGIWTHELLITKPVMIRPLCIKQQNLYTVKYGHEKPELCKLYICFITLAPESRRISASFWAFEFSRTNRTENFESEEKKIRGKFFGGKLHRLVAAAADATGFMVIYWEK